MGGAAWNPKNKTPEELFQELAIDKPEYYDLEPPTLEDYKKARWNELVNKPSGMAANWSWSIKIEREYKEKYGG